MLFLFNININIWLHGTAVYIQNSSCSKNRVKPNACAMAYGETQRDFHVERSSSCKVEKSVCSVDAQVGRLDPSVSVAWRFPHGKEEGSARGHTANAGWMPSSQVCSK